MPITRRLHGRLWPILQTAAAATVGWWLAVLLLPDGRPAFASIAAVVCLGASYGERGKRSLQLAGGVLLGICLASAIVALIGTGVPQIGVMVVLAMTAAILLGGGELLVAESAVSAILLVSLDPATGDGFVTSRIFEGLIGCGVSLAVTAVLFPPDPLLEVARTAQAVFGGFGRALERLASALESRDPAAAGDALAAARGLDPDLRAFGDAVVLGRETARLAPRRRSKLADLERYDASFAQVDYAIRDARVLARHAVRLLRSGEPVPEPLPDAVRELARAVWALAAGYDRPGELETARAHALRAGALAGGTTLAVMDQVRSIAVDLRRAADLVRDTAPDQLSAPTEELLVAA